jgi:hypothetical protein
MKGKEKEERLEKLRTRAASGAVWTDAEWVAWRAL